MQPITPFSITAPGFYGLNTQEAPVDLSPNFALQADNCVIDKFGRIGARKGWAKAHTANTDLGTSNIECIGELIENDGTTTILAAGGGFLFKYSGVTLTTLTYGGGGVAPTISANNWQFVGLNGVGIFFQRGYDPLIYDPAVSTTTFRRLSEKSGYTGTVLQANCALSAYGRVWCADTTTDKNTLKWSDTITPHIWTAGTSGSLNLLGVWPLGGDQIVALGAHNNFLFIFGKKQVLIYSGANTPSTMALSDSVTNIGCIARDSVQSTGDDIIFLSSTGVRSLMRTVQEKSAPLREISKNVRDELRSIIDGETLSSIKAVYSPIEAFYAITFPTTNKSYCFDMRAPLADGASRVTTWTNINPTAFLAASNRKLYLGKAGYVATYSGSLDDIATYRMTYYTTWVDFGNPIQKSILKKIIYTLIGAKNQPVIVKWAFDYIQNYRSQVVSISGAQTSSEYGIAEYGIAQYTDGVIVALVNSSAGGVGRVVQFGLEADINGSAVSIQKVEALTKDGKL